MSDIPHGANRLDRSLIDDASELERAALAQIEQWRDEVIERARNMGKMACMFPDNPAFRNPFDDMMETLRQEHVRIASLAAGEYELPQPEKERGFHQ